ncbi:MAG: cupin domain-containing protein [Candidatus Dormibacteria bacterium]
MAETLRKSMNSPDEVRTFGHGQVEIVNLEQGAVGRATFQPGWRWSEHVKPIAKTDTCQATHMYYVLSGHLRTRLQDGTEFDSQPGDVHYTPPGHDAWVVGDEPCVMIDWFGMGGFAKG